MDNNNSRINQILGHLASAASVAADGVTDAVHSAGNVVGDKYNSVKLNLEIARLKDEQSSLFGEIGRMLFVVKSGDSAGDAADAQGAVDDLLDKAFAKQKEIDEAMQRLKDTTGQRVCEVCGTVAAPEDHFCANCGAKLPPVAPKEPPEAPKPEE